MAHYEHRGRSDAGPYPDWLFLSTMVLYSLDRDLQRNEYCDTIVNLRRRVAAPHFKGLAFVFFVNQHCTSYVYHASTGELRYADGLGGPPNRNALSLVQGFLRDLPYPIPTECTNARVSLQGETILRASSLQSLN